MFNNPCVIDAAGLGLEGPEVAYATDAGEMKGLAGSIGAIYADNSQLFDEIPQANANATGPVAVTVRVFAESAEAFMKKADNKVKINNTMLEVAQKGIYSVARKAETVSEDLKVQPNDFNTPMRADSIKDPSIDKMLADLTFYVAGALVVTVKSTTNKADKRMNFLSKAALSYAR